MSLQLPCDSAPWATACQPVMGRFPGWLEAPFSFLNLSPYFVCMLCVCIKYIFLSSLKKIMGDLSVSPHTILPLLRALSPTVFGSGSPLKQLLVVGQAE